MLKLTPIVVSIDDLLLDPNNPRLVTDLNAELNVPDDQFVDRQDALLRRFDANSAQSNEEEFFKVDDLKASMREIGYVGIDRIVVRPLSNGKYVVLEGNRRTATIKLLRASHRAAALPDDPNRLADSIVESFETLEIMALQMDGLSKEQLESCVSIILGLRHYGSLLEWAPLPKAFNMYHNYMHIEPKLETFRVEQSRIKEVAIRLSIRQSEVRQALKTYITYLDLSDDFDINPENYSLIQAAITNRKISATSYLGIDEQTWKLDEPSKQKLNRLCQFANRRTLDKGHVIVRDPKQFTLVGELVNKRFTGSTEAIRTFAESLLNQVEAGEIDHETGELVLNLESAVDALKQFEANTKWVTAISQLLTKQESELKISDYQGIGNDLLQKEHVDSILSKLRPIFRI